MIEGGSEERRGRGAFFKISLDRVAEYLFEYLSRDYEEEILVKTILDDVMMIEGRKIPPFLKKYKKYEKDFIQIEQTKANKRQIKRVDDEL